MAQTQKELRNALRTYKARNGLTWAQVATLLDVAQDTAKKYSTGRDAINQWLFMKYIDIAHAQNQRLHDELDRVAFILLNNNDAKELEGTL
ncbi:TPA: hypothetical protein U1Z93_002084 [Streptococcus suis]|nr:hypothetical protein [Streptococcus suis]HEM4558111.1 hypothetical protein [Streptococcus suis]HEM4643558.1 hypothetical protein [Streptococcus suis]